MRSIFDGYLTDACATCPDWADGSDPKRGFGCACHFPIMHCPHFAKVFEEDSRNSNTHNIDNKN